MADSPDKKSNIDIDELIALSGMSRATVWRLKRDGKIPFFQPAGKGGRVTFPEDAIERVLSGDTVGSAEGNGDLPERLPGPKPSWMA
jgi:predicted DNA-binding transcriptional regulator AlpA